MDDLLLSVVIPTYQRRDAVCDAVRAISNGSYAGPAEIIVVVDGSADGTAAALAEVECRFPLRIIEQPNQGLASARNRGAAEARGSIILFLDDDMVPEPDLLDQHARFHRAGADAVTGEIPLHPESAPGFVSDALAKAGAWERKSPLSAFDVYGGHLSISNAVFQKVGGFDEQLHAGGYGGEDLDFGLRLVGPYEVRHNTAAVAWQKNSIGPREHMRRARKLGESDLRLIAKHPEVRAELLACRGAPVSSKASFTFQLSRLPLLPAVVAQAAAWSAEIASRIGLGSSAALTRFYFAARSISYWSTLRKGAGTATFRKWLLP